MRSAAAFNVGDLQSEDVDSNFLIFATEVLT